MGGPPDPIVRNAYSIRMSCNSHSRLVIMLHICEFDLIIKFIACPNNKENMGAMLHIEYNCQHTRSEVHIPLSKEIDSQDREGSQVPVDSYVEDTEDLGVHDDNIYIKDPTQSLPV